MTSEPNKTDKLAGTVVITDFAERRAHAMAREEVPTDEDTLVPGTKIDRYQILERLGGGGMGIVYKAHDTELDRIVALKVLPPHLCRNQEYLSRFRAEAQAHARLNSPYVITLFSMLELPAGEVLALEYVEGQTLEQRLSVNGPLDIAEAARIFDQALRAVENVHSCNIVHRDLKPGNIYLTKDGHVKLMDFGVAKLMDQPEHNAQRAMVGTLLYISPEQINGHATDFRSDVYTMGVSLFETVTCRLPFERRSDYALMHAHVQERPPSPTEFRSIPKALETVIMKAIEKDPNRRYQSAAEFRAALLRTGLVERRSRGRPAEQDFMIETIGKLSRHRGPKILGSMWFEGALIAAVVGLLYMLDIIPLHITGNAQSTSPAATIGPGGAAPARATPAPAKPARAPENTPSKYNSLRDAWSN